MSPGRAGAGRTGRSQAVLWSSFGLRCLPASGLRLQDRALCGAALWLVMRKRSKERSLLVNLLSFPALPPPGCPGRPPPMCMGNVNNLVKCMRRPLRLTRALRQRNLRSICEVTCERGAAGFFFWYFS